MADGKLSAEAERFEKLKEKYNQLKQANAVLKKALLEKQEDCTRLEQQVKEKDTTVRQQLEEIDQLQFQNGRISKQIGTLTTQVEELQKQKQQTGWSMQGLISGKQQQEAVQKAEDEIRVLRDELMMKIQENEDLHMRLFEAGQKHDEEKQRMQDARSEQQNALDKAASELASEQRRSSEWQSKSEELGQKLRQSEEALKKSDARAGDLTHALEDERHMASLRVSNLEATLRRLVPFDDTMYRAWGCWNAGVREGRSFQRQDELTRQIRSSAAEVSSIFCSALQLWAKAHGQGGDGEVPGRVRARSRMLEALRRLGELAGELTQDMVSNMTLGRGWPSPAWHARFIARTQQMLKAHWTWVASQSLLLLHDRGGSFAPRTPQEETQAALLSDALWRLHSSVRSLISRLRLVAGMGAPALRCGSVRHFAAAREALQKGTACRAEDLVPAYTGKFRHRAGRSAKCEQPPGTFMQDQEAVTTARLFAQVRAALLGVAKRWESVGRCLSSWAAAQDANPPSNLAEIVNRLIVALQERAATALEPLAAEAAQTMCSIRWPPRSADATGRASDALGASGYGRSAGARLRKAPASVGFEETQQLRRYAKQVSAVRSRLARDAQTQMKQLEALTTEKGRLVDDLRTLQDSHALLQSNFEYLKEAGNIAMDAESAGVGTPCVAAVPDPSAPNGDLVLSSRQRALLESPSVTAQESSGLRQHGFFVDVISLSPTEVSLAAGAPPDTESLEVWEAAVRKVYELQTRNLQTQVQIADGKAMELYLSAQQNVAHLREQEEIKQQLRDEVDAKQRQLSSIVEDMATTRKNYDTQLGMLTEHICTLSAKLSEKDANVASLQSRKLLCGHCGMWNMMGKLLSSETEGKCQTCQGKLLSKA